MNSRWTGRENRPDWDRHVLLPSHSREQIMTRSNLRASESVIDETRSAQLRAMRDEFVSRSVSHSTPVIADYASGVEVWDVDGKRYLDFAGGIGTLNVGHTHPAVARAI